MEKITLKLSEFYTLDAELNGQINQQTGKKISSGLLQEKLPLTTKYWLTKLARKVGEEKNLVEELRNDLIKKHGKPDDKGNVFIPMLIDQLDEDGKPIPADVDENGKPSYKKVINPDYQLFETEYNALLDTEKELEYTPFKLADFERVETTENYFLFFNLVSVE